MTTLSKSIQGGEFLIRETDAQDIFIPEQFTEEQKMMEESLGKIKRVQVLGKDKNVDGRKMYAEAIKLVEGKGFEELMSVREDDKDIRFLIKESNNKIDELFMVMGGKNEFGLLSIVGDGIDLNALYKLSKKIGMDGFEELEFLDQRKGN